MLSWRDLEPKEAVFTILIFILPLVDTQVTGYDALFVPCGTKKAVFPTKTLILLLVDTQVTGYDALLARFRTKRGGVPHTNPHFTFGGYLNYWLQCSRSAILNQIKRRSPCKPSFCRRWIPKLLITVFY